MIIRHGSRKEKKIALTFDDGPNPYGTKKVLGILDKHGIKASFFLIGKWVKLYPSIVREINRKGHLIGNHGYSHLHSYNKTDVEKGVYEISKLVKPPLYIRPPYGNLLPHMLEALSKSSHVILWDVYPRDWKSTADKILANITRNVRNGSIILLHDGSNHGNQKKRCEEMVKALPDVIETLKGKYDFVRLDEMKF